MGLREEFDRERPLEELLDEPLIKSGFELVLGEKNSGKMTGVVVEEDGTVVYLTETETLYMKALMTFDFISDDLLLSMIHGEFYSSSMAPTYISRLNSKLRSKPIKNIYDKGRTKGLYYFVERPDLSYFDINYGDITINHTSEVLTVEGQEYKVPPGVVKFMHILMDANGREVSNDHIRNEFQRKFGHEDSIELSDALFRGYAHYVNKDLPENIVIRTGIKKYAIKH